MNTIKSLGLALILAVAVLAPATARAAALECDQQTSGLRLCLPRYGTDFDQWATATVNAFSVVNSSSMLSSTSAVNTSAWLQTARLGGISTGPVGIWISSATTFTSSVTFMDVTNGVLGKSSATFSAFFGDGSHLTGIASGAGGLYVPYGVDAGTMQTRGQVSVSTTLGGNGSLRVRAGTGVAGGAVAVTLYSATMATESIATAGYMDLYKYTLPANTLVNDGDALYIECMSSHTATSFSKDNKTVFSGVDLAEGVSTSTAQFWRTFGRFIRRNSTAYSAYFTRMRDATVSSSVSFNKPFDPTIDNEILCRGKGGGTAADLQGVAFRVIYEPAP